MFGKPPGYQYQAVQQRDYKGPGLFTSSENLSQTQYGQRGHSFDYLPRVADDDFTDRSQGVVSWICNLLVIFLVTLCTLITFPISGWFVLRVVPNYERIVAFRLGRIRPPKGPGVVLVLPLIDQWRRVDLRTRAFSVPPCKVTTKDGGIVSMGADIQFRIWSPVMSVVAVQDLNASTRLTAQSAMTQSLTKKTVREIQTERVKLGEYLAMDINEMTKPWGLEVDRVELILEGVLQGPEDPSPGPFIMPPSVPGLEGLAAPIQQLAMHFMSNVAGSQDKKDTVSFTDEVSPDAPAAVGCSSAEALLSRVGPILSESLVGEVGACFQFHVTNVRGRINSYYVDLSRGCGACGAGTAPGDPDVTLSVSEQNLTDMLQGGLRPLAAYSSGSLQVEGDLGTAMKLEGLLKRLQHQ